MSEDADDSTESTLVHDSAIGRLASSGSLPRQPTPASGPLYFRQLLAGRDFAVSDPIARQMANFCYLIGNSSTREAVVVDPAYGVKDLLDLVEADGYELTGVLVTHYHADHVGGNMMGHGVEGVAELLSRIQVPVHVQADEALWIKRSTGLGDEDLVCHSGSAKISVGALDIELVHTPGHTPGSQCFAVAGRLVAGDTLFLEGCGRTDFPGGDSDQMYESLTQRLARFDDSTVLYPGHCYSSDSSATMGATRSHNYVYRIPSLDKWREVFGS